jgi:ubiquinone/menaquinone biosynthesis C-methylase UbiE
MTSAAGQYLYLTGDLAQAGVVADAALAQTTERHHAELVVSPCRAVADPLTELSPSTAPGVIFELASGLPSERHLRLIDQAVSGGRRVWLYWPAEQTVECVDEERLRSLRRHGSAVKWLKRLAVPVDRAVTTWQRGPTGLRWIYRGEFPVRRSDVFIKLNLLTLRAQPVEFDSSFCPHGSSRISGVGLYLRADYWTTTPGDTSHVARELAVMTERLVCLTPQRDPLLDRTSVQQVVMDQPRVTIGEDAMVMAPTHYWPIVKAICQALLPSFIYERLSAGESVGAEVSQLLNIPYIVEHHGSEALLREALIGTPPVFPELYSKAEELALRQATVVLVPSSNLKDDLVSRGIDAARVLVEVGEAGMGERLAAFIERQTGWNEPAASIQTGDAYKDQIQTQWNRNPVGSQHARASQPHTLEWFLEVERHRYGVYAPWMPETMEFGEHADHDVLEIGGGMGTDLAQFAAHGATVTDLDLSAGHLKLAEENFRSRGLSGCFVHHDAEALPFDDHSFDLVYSNGVLHHTPNTASAVREIYRVLRPGGRTIVMVYAENSFHYWRQLVWRLGVKERLLEHVSMGEIMSRSVERSANEARPLVKVYTRPRVRAVFKDFVGVEILQRQLLAEELPGLLKWTLPLSERLLGWNLIAKATKPHGSRQARLRPEDSSGRVRH